MSVSPFLNTVLSTSVMLHPYQMDNKIYINLKKNLENQLQGKCFSKYGFVSKIIEIISYKDGLIEAENTQSAALFDITFSCKICIPLKNTQIICEIDRVNKLLITATNGPIIIVITHNRINENVFFKDNNNNIRYKKDGKSLMLQSHDFIKVTLQTIKFHDGDVKIKAIGFINDMATDNEKKKFYVDQYKDSDKLVDFEKYITNAIDVDNEEITE